MFISISRIKKLFKNPMGGLMFLIQYLKSILLKFKKIDDIDLEFDNNKSLIDIYAF
ncbi:MAG: hypothetical protein PHG49_00215 [Candidatus Pacebacteria bacterium]|nr:hypothetical protein [Candidatus Paceibacterota bacterium]